MNHSLSGLLLLLGCALGNYASAADDAIAAATSESAATRLSGLQTRWASIKYQLPAEQRAAEFERLAADIGAQRQQRDSAELMVWEGIVLASQAGAKGGLGALSLVKKARSDFEQAIEHQRTVLDGSALTSLGSLYYQVPGWPLGFGDDDKAKALLLEGLQVNPDGIDANFFYGDFLLDQGDYSGAVAALEHALAAPPRAGRESADAGRRDEIERALQQAREELADE